MLCPADAGKSRIVPSLERAMPPGKPVTRRLIVVARVLALALRFSGTAAGPAMAREGTLPAGFPAWLTSAVQAGFVLGTLGSATLALPDRLDPRRQIAAASLVGAAAHALILVLPPGHTGVLAGRATTGAALACDCPPGMKLAAESADRNDTGLLVGGVTLGSARPHLAHALGGVDRRVAVAAASGAAIVAAALIVAVRAASRAGATSVPARSPTGSGGRG